MARKIGELFYELRTSTDALSRDLKEGERQFGKFADFVKANPVAAVAGLSAAFVGVALAAAKAAGEIETQMRQTTALLGSSREGAAALGADLKAVASAAGESREEVSKLFRSIAENGPNGAQNIKAMADAAIALSQVLGGDFSANAAGLDNITDIFAIDPSRAREVAASLFEIASGRVPIADLLDVLSKIGPDVAALGLDFETTASVITRFLDQGYSVKRVAAAIKEMADNGAQGRAELVRLAGAGVDTAAAMARLADEQDRAQRSADALAKRVKNELNSAWLEFGNQVLPAVGISLSFVVGWLDGVGDAASRTINGVLRAKAAIDAINGTVRDSKFVSASDLFGGNSGATTVGPTRTAAAAAGQPQSPFGPGVFDKVVPDNSIAELGKRLADIKTATTKLESLTVEQLRAEDRQLATLAEQAGNDSQREKIKALRQEIGDELPKALKRATEAAREADTAIRNLREKFSTLTIGSKEFTAGDDRREFEAQLARDLRNLDTVLQKSGVSKQRIEEIKREISKLATSQFDDQAQAKSITLLTDLQNKGYGVAQSIKAYADALNAAKKKRTEADDETARTIQSLDEEAAALAKGAEAYKEYQRQRFVQAALKKAGDDDPTLKNDPARMAKIVADATEIFNKTQLIQQGVQRLAEAAKGGVLSVFAELAQQTTTIATSLGEGGQSLARFAAIAGPLFSGLSGLNGLLSTKDAAGKSLGLLDSLKGANGSDAQGKALGSTVAIIGAVAGIADALDLFGTHAREEAKKLKEAAKAFASALADFAASANPETGAAEAIRQARKKADELSQQARALVDAQLTFRADQNSDVTSDGLREMAAAARDLASAAGSGLAKQLRGLAGDLDEVATTLENVEAAARRQVLANLEDLSVRTLQAAGLTQAAETRRTELEQQRALAAAQRDTTDVGREYVLALQAVQQAERAAAQETQRRAQILQQIDDDNTFLGGTEAQRIQRLVAGFKASFPDIVGGIFEGLDFSSKDGLEKGRQIARDLYTQLAADGISEEERPIIEFLKRFVGDVDSALSGLPDVLDPLAVALEAFSARVELFGTSAKDQFTELAKIFTGKFGDFFDQVLGIGAGQFAGGDLAQLQSFKGRIEDQLREILSDGVISDQERPFYDALKQFLGIVNQAIDDAISDTEQQAADAQAARQQKRNNANTRVQLFDLEGPDAFAAMIAGFSGAIGDLFKSFDTSSLEGIQNAKVVLRGIFEQLEAMTDEEILARFGLTRDELIAALLDTDGGLDQLKQSLLGVKDAAAAAAQAAADFTESVSQDYLRSQGRNQEADINDAKAKRDERIKKAVELKLGQSVLDQIEAIYQSDVNAIIARYAPKVAQTGTAVASGTTVRATDTTSSAATRTRSTTLVGDFGGLSEVTGQSLAGVLNQIAFNTGADGAIARALAGAGSTPLWASLRLPSPPTLTSGGGGLVVGTINISIGALNPSGLTPTDAASAVQREVVKHLGALATAEVKFLGSGKL